MMIILHRCDFDDRWLALAIVDRADNTRDCLAVGNTPRQAVTRAKRAAAWRYGWRLWWASWTTYGTTSC